MPGNTIRLDCHGAEFTSSNHNRLSAKRFMSYKTVQWLLFNPEYGCQILEEQKKLRDQVKSYRLIQMTDNCTGSLFREYSIVLS